MTILSPQDIAKMTNQQLVDCLPKAPELKRSYSSKHYTIEFSDFQDNGYPTKLKLISRNQRRKSKPQIFLELNLNYKQNAIAALDRLMWLLGDKEFDKLNYIISYDMYVLDCYSAKTRSQKV